MLTAYFLTPAVLHSEVVLPCIILSTVVLLAISTPIFQKNGVRVCTYTPHTHNFNSLKTYISLYSYSVQFSSVSQSCPTPCDPMKCSTPGLPIHHQLPEFTQTHVHQVSDAIQPSHPLSSPSPAPNPSQHQSLFQ